MSKPYTFLTRVSSVHVHMVMRFIGESLSEPHIDCDNIPHMQNNDMSVCIIYPMFVAPWLLRSVYALKCSMYSGILTCLRA